MTRKSLVRVKITPFKIISQCQFGLTNMFLLLVEVEVSFLARETITEIIPLTISGITVIDIKSVYLTLANEK